MVLVSKRGRFLVGELIFERGGRIELAGGRRAATPGRMALVEMGQGRGRAKASALGWALTGSICPIAS